MDAILVDDTRVASIGTYGPALARNLAEISQLRINRYSAVAWAHDLRFLVVDDGESVAPSQDSKEFGEEMKSGGGAEAVEISSQDPRDDAGPDDNFNITVTGRDDTASCDTCQRYPVFSRGRRSTKYRIVQFPKHALEGENTLCNHYVAISYCWQSDATGAAQARKGSYRVLVEEENGVISERANKAPDETIDRAVEFASHVGARLIWIDQECLPQDGSQEQELGIQAMDVVYQRAHWSVGLYQSIVSSQCQLDAVASILDWSRQNPSTRALRFPLESDLDMGLFMRSLIDFLDMFCNDPWNQRAWILQELFSSSDHMTTVIRLHTPFVYRGSLALQEQTAAETLKMTGSEVDAFTLASREFLSAGLSRARSLSPKDQGGEAFQRAHRIIKALETLRPEIATAGNKYAYLYAVGKTSFGPRYRCNAAVALSYLRNRDNHRPADRLAIVANLCDYEIRLDTVTVEKSFRSLAVCLFTLAFVNGDLSLLVPEVYQLALIKAPLDGPSWALPFPEVIYAIAVQKVRAGYGLNEGNHHRYTITENGIILPAYVWEVNRVVDFTPVKDKWLERWESLNLQAEVGHQSALVEKLRDPQTKQWVGHLLLDILRHLHTIEEGALANSVWQSIRVDTIDTKEDHDYWLPDDAADLLADEDICANPWPALQLDQAPDGGVGQFWFIDRMMRDSHIWVGNYALPFRPETFLSPSPPATRTAISTEMSDEQSQGSILQSQLTRQLLAMKAHEVTAADPDRKPEDVTIMVAAFLTLAALSIEDTDQRDKRLAARVAAFDVDRPCLVATPFDAEMEKLPRPSLRTMASAWVVKIEGGAEIAEAVNEGDPDSSGRTVLSEGCFRVLDRVKGVWEIMEQTIHTYTFV